MLIFAHNYPLLKFLKLILIFPFISTVQHNIEYELTFLGTVCIPQKLNAVFIYASLERARMIDFQHDAIWG